MDNPTRCFTFSMEDLAQLKELVAEFRKSFLAPENYPTIFGVPFRVTVKSKVVFDGNITNPDCVLSFTPVVDGIYDIHYETANMMVMDVEGMQRPFDFTIKMNRTDKGGKRYDIIKKPSPFDMHFLNSNYKFGVKNSNADVFLLACQTAEFLYAVFPFLMWEKRIGDNVYYQLVPDFLNMGKKVIKAKEWEHRKNTLTDGWDTIHLTANQMVKVAKTIDEHHIDLEINNISLPKYCLSIFDKPITGYYFFEKDKDKLHCRIPDLETYVMESFDIKLVGRQSDDIPVGMLIEPSNETMRKWVHQKQDDGIENWKWIINAYFVINTFMLHFGDVTMEVETKIASEGAQKQNKKNHHHNVSRLFKSYRLIKNWKSQARKKAEITCPCWGVRGHFRHYKNGKVVFIEPFMKGKEKDAYKGKEYALLPYKDA